MVNLKLLLESVSIVAWFGMACYASDGFVLKELHAGRIQSITIGDFNADSRPDIAARTTENLAVFLNAGDGNFSSSINTALPYGPALASVTDYGVGRSEVSADFNGDGKLDLAIKDRGEILFGVGDGTFLLPRAIAGEYPTFYGLTANGDFNGDQKPDLVYFVRGSVAVLLGNGDGTFRLGSTVELGGDGQLIVADFNGDGLSDLGYLHYRLTPIPLGGPGAILVMSHHPNCCEVRIYLGQGDGAFGDPVHVSQVWGGGILAADFNRDGIPDIAAANTVLLGRGDGRFEASQHFWWADEDWYQLPGGPAAAADFDGDSRADLIYFDTIEGRTIMTREGSGDGTFVPCCVYRLPAIHVWENLDRRVGGIADFDGDGRSDVVTAAYCAIRSEFPPAPYAPGCSDRTVNISVLLNRIDSPAR